MKLATLLRTLLALGVCAASTLPAQAETRLNLVSGAVSGKWYLNMGLLGKAITTAYPDMEITMLPGAGGSNVVMVDKGKADVAFSLTGLTSAARDGIAPYSQKVTKVSTLMNIQDPNNLNILVRRDLGVNSIEEIRDKKMPVRISTGPQGGLAEVCTRWLFEAYGFTFEDVASWGGKVFPTTMDGVIEAVQNGQVDIVIWGGSGESWHITEVLKVTPFKALPISADIAEKMHQAHGYKVTVIPREYYKGQIADEDVPTICDWLEVLVPTAMPEETAYRIVKAVVENMDMIASGNPDWLKVDITKMADDFSLPMHPGAARYYRERGWLK